MICINIFRTLKQFLLCMLLIILFSFYCFGYAMDPPNKTVHQHITNESLLIWKSVPYEIKSHGTRPIISQVNGDFNLGVDDIITGSGEEDRRLDTILSAFTNHFWQPDDPDTLTSGRGDYDDGLFLGGSSFV